MYLPKALVLVIAGLAIVASEHPLLRHKLESNKLSKVEEINYRLPNTTRPTSYDISLVTRVDLASFEFNGFIRIGIAVDQPTREIVLHARQLTISRVSLARLSGSVPVDVRLQPYEYEIAPEFLRITTYDIILYPGDRLELDIAYSGMLRIDNAGFYRSSYINANGTTTWLATTQFQSTDARHAFPCYDEPALKATFIIRITHGKRYHAISNMPETKVENSDDTATTSFTRTLPMSTYLVAFVISDFEYISDSLNGIRHRVFASPPKINNTQLALNNGMQLLSAIEEYLDINYSFPKMDQIAVPTFRSGAMENWGLVTYREHYLLHDPTKNSVIQSYGAVEVIAHEFGHQWFGNLISPKWWTYLWLNEGFATLFEVIGVDLVHPNWNIAEIFTISLQYALKLDSRKSTRPMTHYVDTPSRIDSLFDVISYQKSGSVIRMFMHAVTEPTFKKALQSYLNEHAYKSVDENDLFTALENAAKEDKTLDRSLKMQLIFASWSNQKGYPLITVVRDYKKKTVSLKQQRFISYKSTDNETTLWWIPFNYATFSNPNFDDTKPASWLTPTVHSTEIDGNWSSADWVVFNKQQTGFYRVLYDERNYELLSKQLNNDNKSAIHSINRAQILDDLNAFAEQGLIKPALFYKFIGYLKHETEYAPWQAGANIFEKFDRFFVRSPAYLKLRAYLGSLTVAAYEKFGIQDQFNETLLHKFTRMTVVNLCCRFGMHACLTDSYAEFTNALFAERWWSVNTRSIALNNGIRSASFDDVSILWRQFLQSSDPDLRSEIIASLEYMKPELQSLYLNKTVNENSMTSLSKSERLGTLISISAGGEHGLNLGIQLIRNNLQNVSHFFGELPQIVNHFAANVVTENVQKELNELLDAAVHGSYLSETEVESAKNVVKENFEWIAKNQGPMEVWLRNPQIGSSASQILKTIPLLFTITFYIIFFH